MFRLATSVWYLCYQRLVLRVPTPGTFSTNVWYLSYQKFKIIWYFPTQSPRGLRKNILENLGNGKLSLEKMVFSALFYAKNKVKMLFLTDFWLKKALKYG